MTRLIVLGTTGIDECGRLWRRCEGPCVPLDDTMAAIDEQSRFFGTTASKWTCESLRHALRKLAKGRGT